MLFLSSSNTTSSTLISTALRPNQRRRIYTLAKWILIGAATILATFILVCRVDVHFRVYVREWVAPPVQLVIEPLSDGCFANLSLHNPYHQGRYRRVAHFVPGVPLWEDQTCYDFANLVRPPPSPSPSPAPSSARDGNKDQINDDNGQRKTIFFHTYWSRNLTVITDKQLATWQSFAATQNANQTHLMVWISPDDEATLLASSAWRTATKQFGSRLQHQTFDVSTLIQNTPLAAVVEPIHNRRVGHEDLLKLLALYHYGGVWFDLDTLFVRDLSPLLSEEWISQGSCYTSLEGNPFDGALLHFHRGSPYVCEMLATVANELHPSRSRTEPTSESYWSASSSLSKVKLGPTLYYRIYRRLLHHGIKPWLVVPWCFTDPSQCRKSNSLPNAFSESEFSERRLSQVFAYHWHQQWDAIPGSVFRYIQAKNENALLLS
ncbi:hypothetical protein EC973_002165 [Apophysomyces ossiformis]|uniref:Glycosyltransferase family 32 protein n=1 Tax=Apophysomyces ossiformis TaxID=679940 RepID=A0A8H7ERC9_9FUNG|nr:hypothetical protein EC973_002165 [Apophysomyces ossiformis]